jgi:hypothetical protein
VDRSSIRGKFGGDFIATERTFTMGIDARFTREIARRFRGRIVLESCTGGGFTTMSLARAAEHVFTVEIDPEVQAQARANLENAGLLEGVTFILGNVMNFGDSDGTPGEPAAWTGRVNAAFLDPDWAVTGPDHGFRFLDSNTRPPADGLLDLAFSLTPHVALVLPPRVDRDELAGLPPHELQEMFLGESLELLVLFFGDLAQRPGITRFSVPAP